MDDTDHATEREERHRAEALANLPRPPLLPSTGFCRDCADPIEPARLEVHPAATHCTDCAREAEEAARRMRRGR